MGKLKTLKEERAKVFGQIDQMRKAADGREMTAEERSSWENLLKEYDKADDKVKAEERYQEIESRQTATRHEQETGKTGIDPTEHRSAFVDYLVHGETGISPESRGVFERIREKRAEGGNGIAGVSGGVLVPKSLADHVEIALKSYGGMMSAGTVFNTSGGGDLPFPTVNDTNRKATIVSEYQKSETDKPVFGSVNMKAYTYRTPIIPVSVELMQDSAFDLESLLGGLFLDMFGRGVNEHFTTGDGNNKPKGIIHGATACDTKAGATSLKSDDLIDLLASVDSGYAQDGKFMLHRQTLYALLKLKDAAGRFLWQEGLKDGTPPTILGKGYILNDDMPVIGAGNPSVLFGALSKYRIRMVRDFRVVRLHELLAQYLSIGLFGFARMDGVLIDAGTNPVKKLVHATA